MHHDDTTTERTKALFFEGNTLFEAGRLEDALARYEAALALVPERPSILANLGVTQCRLGRWSEAVATLARATEADPTHRDAWIALGLSLEALSNWPDALHALRCGIDLGAATGPIWLSLAHCQLRLGRPMDALASLDEALALDPAQAEAWSQRGSLLRDAGRFEEAAHCFEQAISQGADEALHRFYLASVRGGGGDLPPPPPRAYVETLFNEYADEFQTHLVEQLRYRGHEILLEPLRAEGRRYPLVLDLGCGTGLCGRLIQAQADAVDGVDLAEAMVIQARASGAYRHVVHGDLLPFLAERSEPADLVIAADVFIYVGALDDVFAAVRQRLAPGGCFAFSVELAASAAAAEPQLLPSLRYAHSPAYVERMAHHHGFRVRRSWQAPLREDQRKPITGLYVLLEPA